MKRRLRFYKNEISEWYADLPEWEGSIDDLQMVAGADIMLDILAQGNMEISLIFSDEPITNSETISIISETPGIGGATYFITTLFGIYFDFEIWLCDVTKYVFKSDKMPHKIYLAR